MHDQPFSIKNIGLKILIVCLVLIISYVIFIALISVNIGLSHLDQDGFWVPILAGILSIAGCLWIFFFFSRFITNQMKEKDIIDNI